jgi:hypothetical protein
MNTGDIGYGILWVGGGHHFFAGKRICKLVGLQGHALFYTLNRVYYLLYDGLIQLHL